MQLLLESSDDDDSSARHLLRILPAIHQQQGPILREIKWGDEQDEHLPRWKPPRDKTDLGYQVELQPNTNVDRITEILSRSFGIRSAPGHTRLKNDLVEHIWNRHGGSIEEVMEVILKKSIYGIVMKMRNESAYV
ncbi:hypothetical protein FRX31_017894 [Thalictrum thalictroides]|uniref:Uncharacterized protein n=1 Tax=Thalictrum thalictroides TaxID=46969 RepID=A0A7J6W7M0_THATH|nr:hypothetical protein FRX31_017894 [Thalictrum thalictroides]